MFNSIIFVLKFSYIRSFVNSVVTICGYSPYMRYTYLLLFFICITCHFSTSAQELQNEIFNDEIKSVRIYPKGQPIAVPIIPMNGRLTVIFDDIGEFQRDLEYTIVHCDRNWVPSEDITTYEYLDGFDDATLSDYTASRGTYVDYTIHRLELPNTDMRWKISGNYILKIWDRDNNDEQLMQLRFVVYETRVEFSEGELFRSTRSGFFDTHEELSWALGIKDIALDDPMRSISASVFQNYNWNSMQDSIRPRRIMRDELFFDQHNSVVFPAMREYRLADLRSLSASSFGIHEVQAFADGINVTLVTNELRGYEDKYGQDWDLNGAFVIDNSDISVLGEHELEYVHTMFTLHYFNAPIDEDVYLLGPFNNFTANEDSKMEFEGSTSVFYKELLLKQGVYDYVYATKVKKEPIDFSVTEGFDNRARNDYHVIIYYKPFLGKFDRVISYRTLGKF